MKYQITIKDADGKKKSFWIALDIEAIEEENEQTGFEYIQGAIVSEAQYDGFEIDNG